MRQWSKRKSYYKKQGYKIVEIDSNKYERQQWRITCESKIRDGQSKIIEKNNKKNTTKKSNSSSDRSLAEDTSSDEENEENKKEKIKPKCLLKIKK